MLRFSEILRKTTGILASPIRGGGEAVGFDGEVYSLQRQDLQREVLTLDIKVGVGAGITRGQQVSPAGLEAEHLALEALLLFGVVLGAAALALVVVELGKGGKHVGVARLPHTDTEIHIVEGHGIALVQTVHLIIVDHKVTELVVQTFATNFCERGGDLEIEWDERADTVWMTGPAAFVCDCECNPKEFGQ